nr:hypothetical protein [Tanacetum cinerariifolium]
MIPWFTVMPSRSNRFSFSGYQQQMSFYENVGVLERSVSGAEVLLAKLAQDGESTALIATNDVKIRVGCEDVLMEANAREQAQEREWQQRI